MTADKLKIVKNDRMKYKSNSLSSSLSALGLLANVIFFVVVFRINTREMYDIMLGTSIIYNLLFMLICFLSLTKVKAYDWKYGIVLIVLSVIQFIRTTIIPAKLLELLTTEVVTEEIFTTDIHTRMVIYLVVSGVFLLAAGVTAIIRSYQRSRFIKAVESGEIDISFLSKSEGV